MKENKRISHIQNFIKIPPEEKIMWALSLNEKLLRYKKGGEK